MTADTATVVASLQAANDIESLKSAIQNAIFLDATPGEDRQKLRGTSDRTVIWLAGWSTSRVATTMSACVEGVQVAFEEKDDSYKEFMSACIDAMQSFSVLVDSSSSPS